jgi:hypothetical protein
MIAESNCEQVCLFKDRCLLNVHELKLCSLIYIITGGQFKIEQGPFQTSKFSLAVNELSFSSAVNCSK